MVQDLEYIKKWIIDFGIFKFVVYDASNTNRDRRNNNVAKFITDDPIELKIERFEDWYNNQLSGKFEIVQCDANSDQSTLNFIILGNKSKQEPASVRGYEMQTPKFGAPDGYVSIGEMDTKLENERLKLRVEMLENENNILKEANSKIEGPTATDKFLENLAPFVGPVLSGLFGKVAAPTKIGALDDAQEQEVPANESEQDLDISEDEFKQLCEDLRRWKKGDPDYLVVIHKLSQMTADKMYNIAKMQIL